MVTTPTARSHYPQLPDATIETRDHDEAAALLSTSAIPYRFEALPTRGSFASRISTFLGHRIQLSHVSSVGRMRVQTSLPEEFYAIAVSLKGSLEHVLARKSFVVNPDISLIQSPLHTSVVTTPDRYELVFIRIGRFFITNELQNLLDRQLGADLLFKPPMAMQTAAGRAFRQLVFQLFHELHGSERGTAVSFRVAHLKSALVSLLFQSQRHNYTQLLNRFSAAGSWQLRIAEEYVQEHAHLPITLGDLSAISGVSSRTLQHSFQRKNGCGPMQFLRAIRMQKPAPISSIPPVARPFPRSPLVGASSTSGDSPRTIAPCFRSIPPTPAAPARPASS